MTTTTKLKGVHVKRAAAAAKPAAKLVALPTRRQASAEDQSRPQTFASVFDAIADTAEEAANMKARADLARQITAAFRERGWTQEEAAHHCRVTQPRISDLMNGRVSKFSLDALVNIASAIGRVSVEFRELELA